MRVLSRSRKVFIAAGVCAALVAGACGGGDDNKKAAAPAVNAGGGSTPAAGAESTPAQTPAAAATNDQGAAATAATPAPGGTATASGGAATAAKPGATAAAGSQSKSNAPAAAASGGASSSGGSSGGAAKANSAAGAAPTPGSGAVPGAPAPSSGGGGPKSEIVLGAVGVHTGVIGDILAPIEHGARAWAADVNARGGLNGHPVKLIIADDGGDPGKAVSIGRKLIEQDKISAFYAEQAPGTLQAYIPLAEKAKVPIFGACSCNPDAGKSPIVFSATLSAFQGMNWSHTSMAYKSGKKKISIFYCREVAICSKGAKEIEEKLAPSLGLQVVHTANVSMAAPDYTAEMLAAKNAGAEAIITYVENPTTLRIIRSGKRQNYTPLISSQMSAHDERMLKIGGEDTEGVTIGASMVDWNSPKMADYRAAIAKYVPGGVLASFGENSWVNGKLIEVLAKSFPDKEVKGDDVLKALYAVNGETLGGLVPPLVFKEGVDHDRVNLCSYPTTIKGGKFVQDENYFCQPDWKPVTK
jgi:branched-chain amino acid transport system substrate-binding protein